MATIQANELQIEVEEHGNPSNPALLLIMGLGTQLVHWSPEVIRILVNAGYRVIAFDNRDIGLSEKLESSRAPSPAVSMLLGAVGLGWLLAPYDLTDMADDTVGVLDALNIDRAHIVGASMGGMIAQVLAARYAERVISLSTIMSSTNRRSLPRTDPEIMREIFAIRSSGLAGDELVERTLSLWKAIGTPDGGRDVNQMRELIEKSIARCNYPAGVRRQIAAIVASGDLRRWARQIVAPTLVVHGKADRLTHYAGSVDIAATIRGARLELIDGMGHDMPPRFLGRVTQEILRHLESAEKMPGSSRAA